MRDESLELEICVEGGGAAFELSSSPSGHRRAGCGLIELLTPVMLLAETKLWIAVIGWISAVLAVVSCSCVCVGKLGSYMMSASLSCRRIWNWRHWKLKKSERMSFQISLWLKIAVFFALFVGVAGANNSYNSYAVRSCDGGCSIVVSGMTKGTDAHTMSDHRTSRCARIFSTLRGSRLRASRLVRKQAIIPTQRSTVPGERTDESVERRGRGPRGRVYHGPSCGYQPLQVDWDNQPE